MTAEEIKAEVLKIYPRAICHIKWLTNCLTLKPVSTYSIVVKNDLDNNVSSLSLPYLNEKHAWEDAYTRIEDNNK